MRLTTKILETINKSQLVLTHLQDDNYRTLLQQYTPVIVNKSIYFNPGKETVLTIRFMTGSLRNMELVIKTSFVALSVIKN
jgi:hypothetical protein